MNHHAYAIIATTLILNFVPCEQGLAASASQALEMHPGDRKELRLGPRETITFSFGLPKDSAISFTLSTKSVQPIRLHVPGSPATIIVSKGQPLVIRAKAEGPFTVQNVGKEQTPPFTAELSRLPEPATEGHGQATQETRVQVSGFGDLLERAMSLIQAAKYQEGIEVLDSLLTKNPDDPVAATYKGFCLVYLREYGRALELFEKVTRTKPAFLLAWQGKEQVLTIQGRNQEAQQCRTRILKSKPVDALDFLARAGSRTSAGDLDGAVADLTRALELNSLLAEAYSHRGVLNRKRGLLEDAMQDFNSALRINPRYVGALTSRGNLWRQKGDVKKAIADHSAAIRVNPDFGQAYFNRGRAFYEKQDFGKARSDWERVIEIELPDSRVKRAAQQNLKVLEQLGK